MDKAIKHHFNKDIKEKIRLTGGYTFQTWLLILSDNQKVVFRTQRDFKTGSGRKIIISDIFEREKYFYDNVNKQIGHICPEVYVIDGTRQYYDMSYCIIEYIEGEPLVSCFKDFDTYKQNDILYKIGDISARINNMEIKDTHPYVTNRTTWEEFIANRLQERLTPLVNNKVITQNEINIIVNNMRKKKAAKTLSFLHLDMRHINMIYNNGDIFILDAENCEFGDPLWELATIDTADELAPSLITGYKNAYNGNIDLNSELYLYYKMERHALVLYVVLDEIKNNTALTQYYLEKFNILKNELLYSRN